MSNSPLRLLYNRPSVGSISHAVCRACIVKGRLQCDTHRKHQFIDHPIAIESRVKTGSCSVVVKLPLKIPQHDSHLSIINVLVVLLAYVKGFVVL